MGLILACDAELIPFWQCPSWNFSWELSMVLQAQSDQFRAERFAVLKWSPGTHWPHGQLNLLLTCIGFVNNGNFKFKLNSYYFPRLIMPLGQLRFGKGLPHFEVKCYSAAPTLIDHGITGPKDIVHITCFRYLYQNYAYSHFHQQCMRGHVWGNFWVYLLMLTAVGGNKQRIFNFMKFV